MFGKKPTDEEILNLYYDYVLTEGLTDRERKIGLLAKAELEQNHYSVAVVNRTMASLRLEALKTGLTPAAEKFFVQLSDILNVITPIFTTRGKAMMQNGYLD
ncbi:hypothetical protein [Lacticaseibacillus sharpeae]|uniref:Bacteriocin immunity protein n=1 Tax=Lacticaseibacillus sharpeae JCM 1186 = DSM 20505 TaxID=1291052 RepID=A0A0R1ZRH5_9LACO|nr:hypothetical protein [Lacticaseibacillus sharpeae]KRM54571.1 hypothetical protein FC18_GL000382 [Lacticaseibacillus sharpeae JCM 1186 = DSM 20505]